MPRILIPTRNRPSSLRGLLDFLERFYPGTMLLLADGSDDPVKGKVQDVVAAYSSLDINYCPYPADLPFFERVLDAVEQAKDDYLALGADDDYPLIEVYERAEKLLAARPDIATVVPGDVLLKLAAPDKLTARLSISREVLAQSTEARARNFANWSFATSYGVTRKEVLLQRYRMLAQHNLPGFIDFQVGVNDAIAGKILGLDEIGTIRTQTYLHSYFRPTSPLVYLRYAERILEYRDYVAGQLTDTGLAAEQAEATASILINSRIAELTGQAAPARVSFRKSPAFNRPALQEQFRQFYGMFEKGSDVRQAIDERLFFVADVLKNTKAHQEHVKAEDYETI